MTYCLNAVVYSSDGITKMGKISIDGMNEMKYALRYNHNFSDVFTQTGSNAMIRRGIDKMSKTTGPMISCLLLNIVKILFLMTNTRFTFRTQSVLLQNFIWKKTKTTLCLFFSSLFLIVIRTNRAIILGYGEIFLSFFLSLVPITIKKREEKKRHNVGFVFFQIKF